MGVEQPVGLLRRESRPCRSASHDRAPESADAILDQPLCEEGPYSRLIDLSITHLRENFMIAHQSQWMQLWIGHSASEERYEDSAHVGSIGLALDPLVR